MASWSEEDEWKALESGWSNAKGLHGKVVTTKQVRFGGQPALVAVTKVLWEKYSLFVLDGGLCRMVEDVAEEEIKALFTQTVNNQTPPSPSPAVVYAPVQGSVNVYNIQKKLPQVGWAVSISSRTLHRDQNCSGGAHVPVDESQAERLQWCQKCSY